MTFAYHPGFISVRPLEEPTLQRNVDHCMARGLEDHFAFRRLDIIANGPSASLAPFKTLGASMALNGALGLCLDHSVEPTYWAACDPQPLVTDFLTDLPWSTTYLVASQCDPVVFDRLAECEVWPFDVADGPSFPSTSDPIMHGSSITLTSLQLATRLGYRDLHVWGWDCCILDGEHHANGSALPQGLEPVEFRPDPSGPCLASFLTTPSWEHEVQQAGHQIVPILRSNGVRVTVHGPGFVAHYLDFLENPPNGQ